MEAHQRPLFQHLILIVPCWFRMKFRLNQRPHRRFGHSGHTRRGRLIEKDHELNMDAQDAQDNRDGTLVPEKPAPAMIRCGLADAQECKPADS